MFHPSSRNYRKSFLLFIAPLFIEWFFLTFASVADSWLASLVSDNAAAAVGSISLLFSISSALLAGIAQGGGILLSQYLGSKRYSEAEQTAYVMLWGLFSVSCFVSIGLVLGSDLLTAFLGIEASKDISLSSYIILTGGSFFIAETNWILSVILNTNGYTKNTMFSSITAHSARLIISYILVKNLLSIPAVEGLMGIGIGTLTARLLQLAFLLYIIKRKTHYRFNLKIPLQVFWSYSRRLMNVGLPTILEPISYFGTQTLLLPLIANFGVSSLAARTYMSVVGSLSEVSLFAVAQGVQVFCGYSLGAQNIKLAKIQVKEGILWGFGFALITISILLGFQQQIFSLFTHDMTIIGICTQVLQVMVPLLFIKHANFTLSAGLRASGDTKHLAAIQIFFLWIIYLPLAYLLSTYLALGLYGIWVAMFIDESFRFLVLYARWRSGKWQHHQLI